MLQRTKIALGNFTDAARLVDDAFEETVKQQADVVPQCKALVSSMDGAAFHELAIRDN